MAVPVDKIVLRGTEATESARRVEVADQFALADCRRHRRLSASAWVSPFPAALVLATLNTLAAFLSPRRERFATKSRKTFPRINVDDRFP
jgi:hypothetical protein